jgi:hypothetical protein
MLMALNHLDPLEADRLLNSAGKEKEKEKKEY